MRFHGRHFIGGVNVASGGEPYHGVDAASGADLPPAIHEAGGDEIARVGELAQESFDLFRQQPADAVATFLERIAAEIMDLNDVLIARASAETALTRDRLVGERARTCNGLRMFAELVRDGAWRDVRIDTALPDRQPVPKPDLRRMLIPIGPVAVFGASNFPLAYSVAGGDTASALAAGNPVIVKAHPAHPGTSELVAAAIVAAIHACGMPPGIFSMIHGRQPETSLALVRHPAIKAVGFTGSLTGGRALFDAAAARPDPIPVFAEMGSVNPIFVLPGALASRGVEIAQGWRQSVTLGAGQFCTKPGLLFAEIGDGPFVNTLAEGIRATAPTAMLHRGIHESFQQGTKKAEAIPGVELVAMWQPSRASSGDCENDRASGDNRTVPRGIAAVYQTTLETFLREKVLSEEVFGPYALIVSAASLPEMERAAEQLEGQLTAAIHGTPEDLASAGRLIAILERKAGRLIFNGFPTGVEVCPSMQHGGPWPASTDSRFTSVGSAAIQRFVRPVSYQNFPSHLLPVELQDENPRGVLRLVNNQLSRAAL